MIHLQSRQHYIDRYDKMTVNDCRWRENLHAKYPDTLKDKTETEREMTRMVGQVAWEIEKILITLDWYNKKEPTIQKWLDDDERRDRKLENAHVPENIFCDECYSRMQFESRHLWDHHDKERVLFFFDCPKECKKRKAIYDDGEVYLPEPHLCEKCKSETEIAREKLDGNTIQTTYTCPSCGHAEVDVFELSTHDKPEDPKYEYDRARFCLSGEELLKAQESKRNMDNLKHVVDKMQEKEENKDLYEDVAKLKQLSIPQAKAHVTEGLKDERYINLIFEKPTLERIVSVGFTIEDPTDSSEYDSRTKLTKVLKKLLTETNWRLMSDGISYRLGVLAGRLRVYEKEEDTAKLLQSEGKKMR